MTSAGIERATAAGDTHTLDERRVLRERAEDLRARLQSPTSALRHAPVATAPIVWNNVDVAELRSGTDTDTILDEIARTGFDGVQHGLGFPTGSALRDALAARGLRLAVVYASLPATVDGPTESAAAVGRERLQLLAEGGGDVLTTALDVTPERSRAAGRVDELCAPRLTNAGWDRLAETLDALAAQAADRGVRVVFHPHAGTFVETPDEVERLVAETTGSPVGLCLDVGHAIVGGGDPVAMLDSFGERVTHVHVKDVDPAVLVRLRAGQLGDFGEAVRARLFTELGAGLLDVAGVLRSLARRDYAGWLIVEQDSAWGPPAEAAAIGRRVLAAVLRDVGAELARAQATAAARETNDGGRA
ncbi:MAG: sugar phosphate isomerase/epimerase family protein [Chloroflexota bacterium]